MRAISVLVVVVVACVTSWGQQPSKKVFWSVALVTGVAVGMDLGTTVARDRTLCPLETGTPLYYGERGERATPVMLAEWGVTTLIGWKLSRSHHAWLHRLWWVPMISTAVTHSEGAAHNFARCL